MVPHLMFDLQLSGFFSDFSISKLWSMPGGDALKWLHFCWPTAITGRIPTQWVQLFLTGCLWNTSTDNNDNDNSCSHSPHTTPFRFACIEFKFFRSGAADTKYTRCPIINVLICIVSNSLLYTGYLLDTVQTKPNISPAIPLNFLMEFLTVLMAISCSPADFHAQFHPSTSQINWQINQTLLWNRMINRLSRFNDEI